MKPSRSCPAGIRRHSQTSERAAAAVLRTEAIAATRGHRLHSIGVTWSDDADTEASLLLKSLTECGFDNVVPVRLPEATEALAWGIAEVIGYEVTAVCVIEPETVIMLIVHSSEGAVQTAVNHAIDTEEALLRWLSAVFTRADWGPEALVVVGSGGDLDALMPRLETVLSVPVFAPAEAELALARGAALASAHNSNEFMQMDRVAERAPRDRRRPLAQTGPLAMLVAGAVTFVVSVSVAVSLEMAPERDAASSEPTPAAKTSPDVAAAAARAAACGPDAGGDPRSGRRIAVGPTRRGGAAPGRCPRHPGGPGDAARRGPAAGRSDRGAAPRIAAAARAGSPGRGPAARSIPPAPGLVPAVPTPVPEQRPGILQRIKDRLSNVGRDDAAPDAQQAPGPAAPLDPNAPLPQPEAFVAPPPDAVAPAPDAVVPAPEAPAPPPEAPPLLPPSVTSAATGSAVLRLTLRVAIVVAVVIALVAVEISSRSGVTWRLITFTYQANVLAAAYYLWTLASPRADARVGLRGAAVLYVVIAGIVWNLFLTNHSMGYTAANFLLHVVVPVLALTDWLLIGRGQGRVQWWQPFVWLAYPAAYVVLALVILNNVGRRAPYYFLDPGSVGAVTVIVNICVLGGCVVGLGYVLLAVNRLATPARIDVA